tara:strand:- start:1442 stop:1663 length:222 start_codon:yes stop_codon:yes gene_type:complete
MTRLLILSRKTTPAGFSRQELVELCQDIQLIDTYENVINSTEICDLTERTIKPLNRGQCNRITHKESFLISKN